MAKYNDLKTLFLICNSISGVGMGLLFFSCGVGSGVLRKMEWSDIADILLGLFYIAVGIHGYCGAITENYKSLGYYSAVMCARSVSYIIRLVSWNKLEALRTATGLQDSSSLEGVYAAMIFITILTMMSVLLALTLGTIVVPDKTAQVANSERVTKAIC